MKLFKIVFGLVISAVCLWVVFKSFHFSDLTEALRQASWIWFLPAFFLFLFGYLLRSVRWSILLSPVKKLSPFFLAPILISGFFVNCVMPARAGELARTYATTRWTGIKISSAFGSIAAERITDFFGLLCVMLLSLPVFPKDKLPMRPLVILLVTAIVLLIGFLFAADRLRDRIDPAPVSGAGKALHFVVHLASGFHALASVWKLTAVASLAVLVWMNEAAGIFLVSRVLHVNFTFLQASAMLVGISVGYMIPGAPGAVGTMEFFGREMMRALKFAASPAVSFVIVLHFFQLLCMFLLGVPCILRVGLTLGAPKEPA